MAVSVPPPLYHLNSVAKFRDDASASTISSTTTTNISATSSSSSASTKTKNKRKSLEPKKLSSTVDNSFSKRIKIENSHEGSDGEQTHSPSSSTSSSTSTSSSDGLSLSLQSSMLAPKKRFKQEALKYLEESSRQQSEKSNPFRPWDIEATSPTVKTPAPPNPIPFLYNPLQNFFPAAGFLLAPHPVLIASPKIEPSVPASPDLSSLQFQKSQPETKRPSPPFYPALIPSGLIPKVEPPASPSPSPSRLTSADFKSPQFDAETCQVLSRLYPFLLNRPAATTEPEQDEPLALVKRKAEEDDDDVFIKQEANDSGSENQTGSGKSKQRNYKNMTRERRIEANARERQRVHTITAAFDRLQGAIPTADDTTGPSANKLSKLSIIKIATSYIMVLSRMAGHDYSQDQSEPSIEECIKQCADLVKAEAKSRKKSSESSD